DAERHDEDDSSAAVGAAGEMSHDRSSLNDRTKVLRIPQSAGRTVSLLRTGANVSRLPLPWRHQATFYPRARGAARPESGSSLWQRFLRAAGPNAGRAADTSPKRQRAKR